MSLSGPILVIAESSTADLIAAVEAAGAFPIIELAWAEAAAAVAELGPTAVIFADGVPLQDAAADDLATALWDAQPLVPVFARVADGAKPSPREALPIAHNIAPARFVARLRSAMRVRSLHAAVLRRAEALAAPRKAGMELWKDDPLDDATVLIVGRGRSYPALTLAVGERVSLIGCFSVEAAARYLNARDIDGIVIGDGLAPRMVEAFLIALAEDVRFRDLPIAVLGAQAFQPPAPATRPTPPTLPAPQSPPGTGLANLVAGSDLDAIVAQVLPLVRLHAKESALRRALKSIDAGGLVDVETGLLTRDAFRRNLARAVAEAQERGGDICLARFAFDTPLPTRVGRDAARLFSRLMRAVDFAFLDADGSIMAAFTETDLRAAHVIARRLASVLKHTMLMPEGPGSQFAPTITLATCREDDTAETLVSRVLAPPAIAAG
jgi:hypothetical protein